MSKSRRFDNRHMVLQKGEYQKANGMYEYRWTDAYGKRHSVYAADLDELRIKEQKVELNKFDGIKEPPVTLTVEKLYETWRALKRGIKASTMSGYVYVFESLIRPSFGKKRVIQIKRTDVRAFYISLIEERGVAITTVENVHNVLQQVLQYAVDDDILRKNPCDRVLKELKLSCSNLRTPKRKQISEDFSYLLPQLASIYYAGKFGFKAVTDSDELIGAPITAFIPDINLAIDAY